MFGLFKKKNEVEILQEKYKKLMMISYKLSTKDRKASDAKVAEAQLILNKIEKLL